MRFVVYGAGAIGGVVGGRLAQAGHEVVLIARGDHHDAIRDEGLRLVTPDADEPLVLSIPVVSHPAGVDFRDDDVVLLAMKSQHTGKALSALLAAAARRASRWCACRTAWPTNRRRCGCSRTCTACAWCCPALHLEPGVVEAHASPVTGILDIGRFPYGVGPARREDRGRVRVRPPSSRWRAATSCGGSTASSSTTSATRSTRCAAPTPRRVSCTGGHGTRAPRSSRPRTSPPWPRGGCRPPRRPLPVGWRRRPLPPGLVVVAEPVPGHRVDRGRLPQRRDRAAGPAVRCADPGEPAAATAGGCRRPRGRPPRARWRSTN